MMKINVNNTDKLNTAINEIEGSRVSVRTITAEDIADAIKSAEKRLSALMPKTHWKGVKLSVDLHASTFPASYNGTPESTQFVVERSASGWFVVDIKRYKCKGPSEKAVFTFTGEQKEKMVEFAKTLDL